MDDHVAAIRRHAASAGNAGAAGTGEGAGADARADEQPRDEGPGLLDEFTREFEALGGHAWVAGGPGEALELMVRALREILARRGGYACLAAHPLLEAWGAEAAFRDARLDVRVYRSVADLTVLAGCEVSVTVAGGAIAETGTLVMESHPYQGRLASLLAPVHVGIVPPNGLMPSVAAWLADRETRFGGGEEMPSSVAFATGPSRSADIPGDLALGVHGPGEVHAVLIRA